ncbi:MAG: zinc-dependent metalloprotease [Phycisphaerales bacterium]|nr:zinc-dependent metalloprotease [Phycisphaerales bacterium]
MFNKFNCQLFVVILLSMITIQVYAKEKAPIKRKSLATDTTAKLLTTPQANMPPKIGPIAFKDLITNGSITKAGLFTVYQVNDKYYFAIPDSLLNKEILSVTRFIKVPAGGRIYGGEKVNYLTLQFEKGPNKNIFLRVLAVFSEADSSDAIYKAVKNSTLNTIVAAFDIKAYTPDSTATLIDVTDFFKGDNQVVALSPDQKRNFSILALAPDRSYISKIKTFPTNTEIKTVKTYAVMPPQPFSPLSPIPPANSFPIGNISGAVTMELNTSWVLLPSKPMLKRQYDPRVGFFTTGYDVFSDTQQRVNPENYIVRWRLEPKPEDVEKYKKGILVEPQKQIVYYIDPATPNQWRPYFIQGVNAWNKAFEQAGFKNAICAKEWPENDSAFDLEDARYSVIRYFASDIANAYGPNVHDPRTGEIIESHIGWYHNVMKILHDWYFIQTAAVDSNARKMVFSDSLMGKLISFVVTHEVGHTLGLRHNMGSSSTVPVALLRDKKWLADHGHTPSIMDYARFDYVAQPEDSIPEESLFPKIGAYDKWAIQWGYRYLGVDDVKKDKDTVSKWVNDSLANNKMLYFGTESNPYDPRDQTEDLGDDNMQADSYGILNLQREIKHLATWTYVSGDLYDNLDEMYQVLVRQYKTYIFHVVRNIAGVYETPKSVDQSGAVYKPNPKYKQEEATDFLNKQLFQTPYWLLDTAILNKVSYPISNDAVADIQKTTLTALLDPSKLYILLLSTNRFGVTDSYTIEEFLKSLQQSIWTELSTHKPIDFYRRNLQKIYVTQCLNLVAMNNNPAPIANPFSGGNANTIALQSDISSLVKVYLKNLKKSIDANINLIPDNLSQYHLQDISDRIANAFKDK